MNPGLAIVYAEKMKKAEAEKTALEQRVVELERRLAEAENGYEGTLFLDRSRLRDAEEKIKTLTADCERFKREGSNLRAQLFFLEEGSREAVDKATARSLIINDIGQCFCPRCHACVWEQPNIPVYWRRCQYANKEPPEYCPRCGQHLKGAPDSTAVQFEEDPLKNQHKGEQKNGTWYHRR